MRRALALAVLAVLPTVAVAGEPFEYMPPGDLVAGSGQGRADDMVYAPGMRFPMETGPAFANSQVWGHGGSQGPGGSQCDVENYSYPWRDNYCETRTWDMPLCPSGEGHQGQDIRPATCDDGVHWNVSAADGDVTSIGSYSVYVTAPDGTRFDYLHGGGNIVSVGQGLARGERINRTSNEFGGTATTIHLHFNIRQDVAGVGVVYAPTYMSLVASYQELYGLAGAVTGTLEATDCEALTGWAWDEATPDAPIPVQIAFGGEIGAPDVPVIEVLADRHRDDLCDALGSCEHAFEVEVPLSLRDGKPHDVHVYAVDGEQAEIEIEASPLALTCAPPSVPPGVRRLVDGPDVLAAWAISPLWDVAHPGAAVVDGLDEDRPLPSEPVLVASDADPASVWLMDPGYRRLVGSAEVAAAWGMDWASVQTWPADVVDAVPIGTPVRPARLLVAGDDGRIWALDDVQCPLDDQGQLDGDCNVDDDDGDGDDGGGTAASDDGDGGDGAVDDGGGDTGSGDGDALPESGGGDDGCGCRHGRSGPSAMLWLMIAAAALRRRRR